MTVGRRGYGDGEYGERRPDPKVPRQKYGQKDVFEGPHMHGNVKHSHSEGNVKHKHTTYDMRTESDGSLVP